MSKAGQRMLRSARQALAFAQGKGDGGFAVHVPDTVDVKAIRTALGLKQDEFAAAFGFTLGAVRDWEQKRVTPDRSTRAYLKVIEREPRTVQRALTAA